MQTFSLPGSRSLLAEAMIVFVIATWPSLIRQIGDCHATSSTYAACPVLSCPDLTHFCYGSLAPASCMGLAKHSYARSPTCQFSWSTYPVLPRLHNIITVHLHCTSQLLWWFWMKCALSKVSHAWLPCNRDFSSCDLTELHCRSHDDDINLYR